MYVRAQIVIKGVHLKRGPDLQAAYWLHFHRSSHQLQLYAGVARTTSRGDSRDLGELYCMRTEIHVGWGSFSRLAWKHQDFLIKHYNKNAVHFQCLCEAKQSACFVFMFQLRWFIPKPLLFFSDLFMDTLICPFVNMRVTNWIISLIITSSSVLPVVEPDLVDAVWRAAKRNPFAESLIHQPP